MIVIDPKDTRVGLAFIALVFIAPMALISYGRHQGWAMHQECLQEVLSRNSEPEPAGSHSLFRQALGAPPAGETTPGAFAQELLSSCKEMP